MRASTSSGHFALLPRPVIQEDWLLMLPAYLSNDAELSRAAMKMLFAAWRGNPTGSLSIPSIDVLAHIAGISRQKAIENLGLLEQGWEKKKNGLWVFAPIADVAQSLLSSHQQAIQHLGNELVMAAQSPSLFGPAPSDLKNATTVVMGTDFGKAKIKSQLPDGFRLTQKMQQELQKHHFTVEQFGEVEQHFIDYARSRSERSADWEATFRLWLSRAIQWKTFVPAGVSFDPPTSMVVRRTNRNAAARDQSMDALQRAQSVFKAHQVGGM